MEHELFTYRERIADALVRQFSDEYSPFGDIELWSNDVRQRLQQYALRGKLIRGSLVPFSYSLFHPGIDPPKETSIAGAAMELLQSFLLIHDDIMDQDDLRRGEPAIHRQYTDAAPKRTDRPIDSQQYGLSMGVCVGDIAAFYAIHVLSNLEIDAVLRNSIIRWTSKEIMLVGLAQMQDVHHGYVADTTLELVNQVYTYKTGRYTFSLPMVIGALVAGESDRVIRDIIDFGEHLGRIFQIRDDYLGLFQKEAEMGKPIGSDLREDKKTVYRQLLFQHLNEDDPIRAIFGKAHVTPEEIETVQEAMISFGVVDEVDSLVEREAQRSKEVVRSLGITPEKERSLEELIDFSIRRSV